MAHELTNFPRTEIDRRWSGAIPPPAPRYIQSEYVAAPGDPVALNALTSRLWRRKGVIIAMAVLGLIIGGGVSLLMTPTYRARTSIQLEGFNNDQISPITASLPNASPENYLQNQVKVLESDTLAKRVADALKIGTSKAEPDLGILEKLESWIGFPHTSRIPDEEQRIKAVKDALTIRTSLQSQVIELFFDSPDPEKAAQGANAAKSAFVDMNREAREQLVMDTTDWLNKQAADLKASVEKANQHLQSFARSTGLVLAGNEGTVAQEQTRLTQEALGRAEADRAAKQSRYETAASKGTDLFSDTLATGPFHQYQVDLANMRRELAQLQTLYTPTNYKVERLKAQIAETERAMEEERKATVARMGNEYAAASRLEKLLSEAHARQLRAAEQEMANDRQYNTLKSEIDTTQKLYETVLQKAKEAGAASALRATNIRLIDAATVPSEPYSPKTALNMAIGFALGTIGGFGLVLFTDRSNKVRRPGEIRVLDIPELGVIPSAKDARALDYRGGGLVKSRSSGEVGLVARDHANSILSESFRGALTSILFGSDQPRDSRSYAMRSSGQTLVVTSVDMMEGKTTVLTNLGVVAAERRQRVLLIDADLRRPRLHDIFSMPNDRGLTDVLLRSHAPDAANHLPLESFVRPTSTPGLSVLPTGPVDSTSMTLLHSADFYSFLQRCRRDFDFILIDTPPLMLYADARILGRLSDGVVMVVRANTRSQEELKAVCERLRQDQIPVLGTILNDWRMDPIQTRAYGRYRDHYQRHA
ncbi:MAG TPA: polysaccharide biosynthesis tyrosine autokinase [Terriglobales bacterium]|nr:polysaccharide biosynthesis tyrosine autokinase [Terriglobales bacterium]